MAPNTKMPYAMCKKLKQVGNLALSEISLLLIGVYKVVNNAWPIPKVMAGATSCRLSSKEPIVPFFTLPRARKDKCTDSIKDCDNSSSVS